MFAVGTAVGGGVPDGVGPAVASSAASDGVGGTTSFSRKQPGARGQRAAHEEERSRRKQRDAPSARQRTQGGRRRDRDLGQAVAEIGRGRLVLTDLGAVPGTQSVFELSVGHRSVLVASAGSIASRSRFMA